MCLCLIIFCTDLAQYYFLLAVLFYFVLTKRPRPISTDISSPLVLLFLSFHFFNIVLLNLYECSICYGISCNKKQTNEQTNKQTSKDRFDLAYKRMSRNLSGRCLKRYRQKSERDGNAGLTLFQRKVLLEMLDQKQSFYLS